MFCIRAITPGGDIRWRPVETSRREFKRFVADRARELTPGEPAVQLGRDVRLVGGYEFQLVYVDQRGIPSMN